MTQIKQIVVSGFRGVLAKLELDFAKGGSCQSMILYGANGTGKSSITDAWEWVITGKIQHLAREGAEESAYPHMAAERQHTYVEIQFSDPSVGTVGLEFDPRRVTMPKARGTLVEARKRVSHPCHIRYADLTRFVLQRKTERYDALASLMGFVPQMEYQKALRRVQNQLESDGKRLGALVEDVHARFKEHFALPEPDGVTAIGLLAARCQEHGIETATTREAVAASDAQLKNMLRTDPKATLLANLHSLETAIKSCSLVEAICPQLATLVSVAGQLRAEQVGGNGAILLLPLFRAADDLLAKAEPTGCCPLCGQFFEGDLKSHVQGELSRMQHLQEVLQKLNDARAALTRTLGGQKALVATFDCGVDPVTLGLPPSEIDTFRTSIMAADDALARLREALAFDTMHIQEELVRDLKAKHESLVAMTSVFGKAKEALLALVVARKREFTEDPVRAKLVEDARFVSAGLRLIQEMEEKHTQSERATSVIAQLGALIDDYVEKCLADVEKRFSAISEKVELYFGILEKHTAGLGSPRLRLLADQDRSVVLEVYFHGTTIQPAHKYLSESQLNSFGLAVFLASAVHFNDRCRFLLLDDVVNSFDAYKRPQLIELIKHHLNGHQILLMTHDRFWRDLLHRQLPNWKKMNFTGYQYAVGPVMARALGVLEQVEKELAQDEAERAGQIFARYLEDVLQELCEAFEVEVKFNRRGEYTLDTLLDRFKVRVQEKLKASHRLTALVDQLFRDNAYRNWSIHCKNPESPIHVAEVERIVTLWKEIEATITCQAPCCKEFVRYDGKGAFQCRCGKTLVAK
jgi:DNA repair exonuclease SbcCD ATPase subunit